mmetsp:Transcript_28351/g.67110  ORF Transcript_28351/g.67110 Transcript_28351/m.67110 type:complete len:386 (+) Transcript_28351:2-1159(+)
MPLTRRLIAITIYAFSFNVIQSAQFLYFMCFINFLVDLNVQPHRHQVVRGVNIFLQCTLLWVAMVNLVFSIFEHNGLLEADFTPYITLLIFFIILTFLVLPAVVVVLRVKPFARTLQKRRQKRMQKSVRRAMLQNFLSAASNKVEASDDEDSRPAHRTRWLWASWGVMAARLVDRFESQDFTVLARPGPDEVECDRAHGEEARGPPPQFQYTYSIGRPEWMSPRHGEEGRGVAATSLAATNQSLLAAPKWLLPPGAVPASVPAGTPASPAQDNGLNSVTANSATAGMGPTEKRMYEMRLQLHKPNPEGATPALDTDNAGTTAHVLSRAAEVLGGENGRTWGLRELGDETPSADTATTWERHGPRARGEGIAEATIDLAFYDDVPQ